MYKKIILNAVLLLVVFSIRAQRFEIPTAANTIFCSNENELFVGAKNGVYQLLEQKLSPDIVSDTLNVTALNKYNGYLLIGTRSGNLYIYKNELKKVLKCQAEISKIMVLSNSIYVATKGNGLFVFNGFMVQHFGSSKGLKDTYVYDIAYSNSKIYIATDQGIYIYDIKTKQICDFEQNSKLEDLIVCSLYADEDSLYIGTQLGYYYVANHLRNNMHCVKKYNSTIHRLTENLICTSNATYNKANPEAEWSEDKIIDCEVDKEGNQWMLSKKELEFDTKFTTQTITQIGKFAINNVHSIYHDGTITYLTPNKGLLVVKDHNVEAYISLSDPKRHIDITSIFKDSSDNIWIGTMGDGLFRMNPINFQFQKIKVDTSHESSGILSVTGNANQIWLSSLNGSWTSPTTENKYIFKSIEETYGLKKFYVYKVLIDQTKRLWFATDGQGILILENNKLKSFYLNDSFSTKVFYSIEADANNNLWYLGSDNNVYVWKDSVLYKFNSTNSVLDGNVKSIHGIKDYMVVATDKKIVVFNTISLESYTINFNTELIPELNSITKTKSSILIGCDSGIAAVTIPKEKTIFQPSSFIKNVYLKNKFIDTNKHEFSHSENNFMFEVSYHFNQPNTEIYARYKLEGYEDQWINSNDRKIYFPQLAPGKYKFISQSSTNPMFYKASEISYLFKISNPFWNSWWFVLFCLGVLAFLIRIFTNYRIKQSNLIQKIENEKLIVEFDLLNSQINPHFLFNSFNSLMQIIEEEPQKAIKYTSYLSDMYRSIINYKDKHFIPLEEEIQILENFILLNKIRYGDNLTLLIQPFEAKYFKIIPLSLQLLAENAIKHNIISEKNPMKIEVKIDTNSLTMINTKKLKMNKAKSTGMGLINIRNRYKTITDKELQINETENYFSISLPLLHI